MAEADTHPDVGAEGTAPLPVQGRVRYLLYLAPMIVLPLVILFGAVFVVPTDWFAEHSGDPFLVTLGYGAMLHQADCRITIFGDSTAMIGVNPDMIAKRTGLTTCNIAETEGMSMINGTMVLDQFLTQNPRPQFIVFLYAPEDLDPQSQRNNAVVTTFEAVTYRFRQPHKFMSFIALMKHPDDFFSWAVHGARWALDSTFAKPLPPETRLLRFKTHGQSALKDPQLTSCGYHSVASPPDIPWVNSLRTRYGVDGSTVLIDAMPMPDCDPDQAYFQHQLSGLIDNQLTPLPMAYYYGGARHVNPKGSVPLSNMIADQVLERLNAHPTPGAR